MSVRRQLWALKRALALVLLCAVTASADDSAGFYPRIAFTAGQLAAGKKALRSDAAFSHAFALVKGTADKALASTPNPVQRIFSEGRLYTDAEKRRSLEARRDLYKIEALGYAAALTDKPEYASKAMEFILAWMRSYESDGNPINETEFVRLMRGYDLTRALFSAGARADVDRWLLRMAEKEKSAIRPGTSAAKNNHMSHRLKIIGHVGFVLPEPALATWVAAEYRRHVDGNLNPDGTTFDFHQRDALHYQVYDLLPLVELAVAADKNGEKFYAYVTARSATLENAIAFLIPYVEGEKSHREFVHSTVKFDGERSAAGDPAIRVGASWKPEQARRLFDLAGYFTPRFHEVRFPAREESFERLVAKLGR